MDSGWQLVAQLGYRGSNGRLAVVKRDERGYTGTVFTKDASLWARLPRTLSFVEIRRQVETLIGIGEWYGQSGLALVRDDAVMMVSAIGDSWFAFAGDDEQLTRLGVYGSMVEAARACQVWPGVRTVSPGPAAERGVRAAHG